mmetsp:Transcript_19392/g.35235  ORF Transcript_19392/g.35235 Transcript_19392/m.35235 type:complete len:328 (-) Transcript_19392:354-1337(-)
MTHLCPNQSHGQESLLKFGTGPGRGKGSLLEALFSGRNAFRVFGVRHTRDRARVRVIALTTGTVVISVFFFGIVGCGSEAYGEARQQVSRANRMVSPRHIRIFIGVPIAIALGHGCVIVVVSRGGLVPLVRSDTVVSAGSNGGANRCRLLECGATATASIGIDIDIGLLLVLLLLFVYLNLRVTVLLGLHVSELQDPSRAGRHGRDILDARDGKAVSQERKGALLYVEVPWLLNEGAGVVPERGGRHQHGELQRGHLRAQHLEGGQVFLLWRVITISISSSSSSSIIIAHINIHAQIQIIILRTRTHTHTHADFDLGRHALTSIVIL